MVAIWTFCFSGEWALLSHVVMMEGTRTFLRFHVGKAKRSLQVVQQGFQTMIHQIAALAGAFLVSVLITPIFRKFAIRVGLVDRPDPTRKLHRQEVALSGGVVVLLSCFLAAGVSLLWVEGVRAAVMANPIPVLGLGISSVGIVLLGLVDDKFTLRGRQKLLGQIVLVSIVVLSGFSFPELRFLGFQADLGVLAIPISIGWLLLTVNALNLIDGADGLCSTVGWIASAGFAAMATIGGHTIEGSIAAGLAGALLGFLVYNFPPAKIFLGDAGSMLIGLLLGALATRASLKEATAISLFAPVTMLAIPLFDSGVAILRRKLTGRSIFSVDRGHLHHSLLRHGFSNAGVVFLVSALCSLVALGAILGMLLRNDLVSILAMFIALGGLVASRVFGHAELRLLASKLYHFGGSLVTPLQPTNRSHQRIIHLQGSRGWNHIWDSLIEFAESNELSKVCLDLNVPWLHEGFHANWHRNKLPEIAEMWVVKLPVRADGRFLGRLEVYGRYDDDTSLASLSLLAELMESLQPDFIRLLSDSPASSEQPMVRASATQLALPNHSIGNGR